MTQTPPKPGDYAATNGHNPKPSKDLHAFERSAHLSSKNLANSSALDNAGPIPKRQKAQTGSAWKQLYQSWGNLRIRWKLTVLLVVTAAIPTAVVTEGIIETAQKDLSLSLQQRLATGMGQLEENITEDTVQASKIEANTIGHLVETSRVDLSNPQSVAAYRGLLQSFLTDPDILEAGSKQSFLLLTDAQGKVVAQSAEILADDFSNYPPLPTEENPIARLKYRPTSIAIGTYLGDIPIVKNAISGGRLLGGTELLKGDTLKRLGLEQQANIGLRPQNTQGLPEAKKPSPEGLYDIDQGRAGLVSMAVHPLEVNNRFVGTAIVGTLLNRNYQAVDEVAQSNNISVVTLFAQDWRVSTNVPYSDNKTRAIGTRASREVAETVLNQGKEFLGQANIVGSNYLTVYRPIYDHQKELNSQAKPVGMLFVGDPEDKVQSVLQRQRLFGYGLGIGSLLLAGLFALPVAGTFSNPIRRLARFTQRVGTGERGIQLEATDRQDEIGILSQELNQMAINIEASLEARRQEAERASFFANIATSRASNSQELEEVFNNALKGARETLEADRVVVYRFYPDWSGYITAESVAGSWPRALADTIEDSCIGEHLIEAYKKGRVVPTNNVFEAGFHPEHLKLMERLEIKANLVTPILRNNQLFGLLIAHHCAEPHDWQQPEISFLTQLAAQLGLILDRVTFLEQAEQARQEAEGLAKDQRLQKEGLQKRALELLMEVDPISKGDLTIRANVTEDEIGTLADSYNATVGSLRKIVTQVQSAAQHVSDTVSNSGDSVQGLSVEALEQAEQISAALVRIQEMSNSIRAVAANAEQAGVMVQQASHTVEEGDIAMNRTVDGILAIRETVAETSKKVKRLGESSQKISKVVNLIGTFAAQTNLLALNASIEAARAGEEGRGFAVVADEVRSLARQSAEATAEIEKLVADIQAETNEVVVAMESGTEQVVMGTKLVDETRMSLNKITAASAQISSLVDAITQAAVAQSQTSDAVAQTMTNVAAIADKTSTEAIQVSSSFKELLTVAQGLQSSVGQFKVS
ncbi:methyl-accepting chemotaxis protein [Leptolyngbya sp. FACHB-261]|uniref:methyl-accepting chemotaxis protein n=1 Tax=Leptolyngbya sp. FACHB-261 TaxID=2692806 RepID=UPI001683E32C|nr:methyl-accepting chemotaxis protein [Leptolyngbya sp. FACHB-261]MBD2100629.1 cache domain-containing protein [Leptolyngbya sp. FACHB-261]